MKILVVCPTLSDSALSASFRLIHLLDNFLKNQVYLTIYVSDPDISELLKNDKYNKYLDINIVRNTGKNHLYYRLFTRLFGVPDSLVFWGRKVKKIIFKQYGRYCFDAVFTSSPPHSLQVVGMEISKKYDIPHFSDFRDDWMGSHRLKHVTPLHSYLSTKNEMAVLQNSKLITHAIPFVAKEWKIKFAHLSEKIYPISNGYPDSIAENIKPIIYPKNTIVYFGGDYDGFVIKKLLKIRNELIQSGLSETWMIVTGGPFDIPFENDETWVHYGNVPQHDVYNYLCNGTIHISLLPPGDLLPSRTIPLKLYTQVTTNGSCVFIGNEGATTELFKDVYGVYFMGKEGWENLVSMIENDEHMLFTTKYRRINIERFNYKILANNLLLQIQDNLK
jgi:hypothetical protein